ncbi:MAG: hypothetical protein WCI02_16205 [Planctomycetota bacterium]
MDPGDAKPPVNAGAPAPAGPPMLPMEGRAGEAGALPLTGAPPPPATPMLGRAGADALGSDACGVPPPLDNPNVGRDELGAADGGLPSEFSSLAPGAPDPEAAPEFDAGTEGLEGDVAPELPAGVVGDEEAVVVAPPASATCACLLPHPTDVAHKKAAPSHTNRYFMG